MQITKYLHSCLLIEENGKTVLIDPGQFTYEANVLDLPKFTTIDYLLITHEHADHFYLPFVKGIKEQFSETQIITTQSIAAQLQKEAIIAQTEGTSDIVVEPILHEDIVLWPAPENVKFTVFSKLTHPGDSYHFTKSAEILAMPMTAPWGSMAQAMKKVLEVKPKVVIPIHDWHWKDEALDGFYSHIADLFKQHGIDFKQVKTGKSITV